MADNIRATPRSNRQVGALADIMRNVDEFARKPFGYSNPPAALLSDLLGIPAIYRTLERVSYGEPLLTGKGQASRMRPDTEEALLSAPQFVPGLKQLAAVTKDLPIGAAIKPKGGNWLAGSVEEALGPLRSPLGDDLATARDYLANAQRESPELVERYAAEVSRREKDAAMNSWIDKQLSRYVRNEMATPEDPVRALAERGVLHMDPQDGAAWIPEELVSRRKRLGHPEEGLAATDLAKQWETASDYHTLSVPAGRYLDPSVPAKTIEENLWLSKVPPETPVYHVSKFAQSDLGFSHLIDELRNALNPESGLPRELLLKYGSLERLSVPQAVERVAKINEWRAAQKAAADAARASNPATQLFREYPEQGFKWVELKPAETLNPEYELKFIEGKNGGYWDLRKPGAPYGHTTSTEAEAMRASNRAALEDALKYEGETMGHCVGGYCPDVLEGRSRIYSLRDAKGEPHVTIEVRPGSIRGWDDVSDALGERRAQELWDEFNNAGGYDRKDLGNAFDEFIRSKGVAPKSKIVQIKGKQNRAPKEDYLPFVQDFVKSQQWSDIGDLPNTGLVQLPDKRLITRQQFDEGAQQLMPEGDAPVSTDWLLRQIQRDPDWWERSKGAFEGYAHGGLVEHSDPGYNPDRIDALAAQLRTELFA